MKPLINRRVYVTDDALRHYELVDLELGLLAEKTHMSWGFMTRENYNLNMSLYAGVGFSLGFVAAGFYCFWRHAKQG